MRGIDLVARYGGEEFMLVMPETDAEFAARSPSGCEAMWRRWRHDPLRRAIPVTVSIGIAEWRGRPIPPRSLTKRADRRSTRPSAPAATGWWRAPPEPTFIELLRFSLQF